MRVILNPDRRKPPMQSTTTSFHVTRTQNSIRSYDTERCDVPSVHGSAVKVRGVTPRGTPSLNGHNFRANVVLIMLRGGTPWRATAICIAAGSLITMRQYRPCDASSGK
jgi:hypothetical protein